MNVRFTLCVLASLFIAATALAASNLNLSKSNFYRLTYSSDLASPAQVKAILAELDKMGPIDEAKLKQWLPANFKRLGIEGDRIKRLIVIPRGREMKETGIILLTRPEDEAAAVAVTMPSGHSR